MAFWQNTQSFAGSHDEMLQNSGGATNSIDIIICLLTPTSNGCCLGASVQANQNRSVSKPYPDDSSKAELKWDGRVYMCGNCKKVLALKQESDLEKQLNQQRIQQQMELEDLQHKQRMRDLHTLLATDSDGYSMHLANHNNAV